MAAVIAEAHRRNATIVEPSIVAQEAWLETIGQKSKNVTQFLVGCTPSYFNGAGTRNPLGEPFGDGPGAFHELLRQWRETNMDEVFPEA